MVHCNHTGGGWTDCNSVGGNMAQCTTMGVPGQQPHYEDGGRAVGEGIGKLIVGIRERSFRAKVGSMLAAGDCAGAAKFAFEKGRLELGSEIQRSCLGAARPPMTATAPAAAGSISQLLRQAAERAETPASYDANTTVTKIEAMGDRLVLSAKIKDTALFTDQWRSGVVRDLCDPKGFGALVQRGAIVRTDFQDSQNRSLGTLTVNFTSCR